MIAYLKTWRYGQEATNVYHGLSIMVDITNHYLIVNRPVIDSGRGHETIVTVVGGDEITVEDCAEGCGCGQEQPAKPPF